MAKTREDGFQIARDLLLRTTSAQLAERFSEHFTEETILAFVEDVVDELEARFKVKTHVPTFALRFARDRLAALAKHEGKIVDHRPVVLFVCERNDGVSQMAAALFEARAGADAVVYSAGTRPAPELLRAAVEALHEVGLDLLGGYPKPLTKEIEQAADVIVTLDPHDTIAVVEDATTQYHAWRIAPEHGQDLDSYRAIRDELQDRVDSLVAETVGERPAGG